MNAFFFISMLTACIQVFWMGVVLFLYRTYKERVLRIIAYSDAYQITIFLLNSASESPYQSVGPITVLLMALPALLTVWCVCEYLQEKFPRSILYTTIAVSGVTLGISFFAIPLWIGELPASSVVGGIFTYAGIKFTKAKSLGKMGRRITIVGDFAMGIYCFFYPGFNYILVLQEWLLLFVALISIVVSIGILVIYFEKLLHRLTESELKFRDLANSLPQGAYETNLVGEITFANKRGLEMFGYTEEDLRAGLTFEQGLGEEDRIKSRKKFKEILAHNEISRQDYTARRKDGSTFPLTLYTQAILRDGKSIGVRGLAIDATEQKQTEATLLKYYQEALEASKMKSDLITFASHELKTPLTPIVGWAELFQQTYLKEGSIGNIATKEVLENLFHSANRLKIIVENFLDISRIESSRFSLQVEFHSVATLIRNAINAVHNITSKRSITIQNNASDEMLWIDAFRIGQVFINILSNAAKYSPTNTRVLITSESDREYYTLCVIDQGHGFTPEELKNAWEPFSPSFLQKKIEGASTGTGIGLYFSKKVVEMHKGMITIISEGQGKGSKVTISLPKPPTNEPQQEQVQEQDLSIMGSR